MASITSIRARLIERARDNEQTTPSYWDRDCRCCMALPWSGEVSRNAFTVRTGIVGYHIKGAGHRVIIMDNEEIHTQHSDEEIAYYMARR